MKVGNRGTTDSREFDLARDPKAALTWTRRRLRLGGLLVSLFLVVTVAPAAFAEDHEEGHGGPGGQGGRTTPSLVVTAQDPGTSSRGARIRITLNAHSEKASLDDPSCRPSDATLDCWATLILSFPDGLGGLGGLTVTDFEVHRVAVGEPGHGGELGEATAGPTDEQPTIAHVNGRAVVTDPGVTGLQVGDPVQLKIKLVDKGRAQYQDEITVEVYEFVDGPDKPFVGGTGPLTVQQVQIHYLGNT